MEEQRVLITDRAHPLLAEGLTALGFAVDVEPNVTLAEVWERVHRYAGIVINTKVKADADMLARGSGLRFIARLGSGLEIIDLPVAAERGIRVFSAPEGNCNAVAEHALGMLLSLSNRLRLADCQVRELAWDRESCRGWELAGRTVGIVGMGHTGRAFARKLRGMDVQVLGHDKYAFDWMEEMPWVKPADAAELQRSADILSIHLPLTPETHHYMHADYFAACRPGVIVINTARGNHIRTADLLQALEQGQVGGVCLDVFENERPASWSADERRIYEALLADDRVVVSPHVAGWTVESLERIASVLLEKITRWAGEGGLQKAPGVPV